MPFEKPSKVWVAGEEGSVMSSKTGAPVRIEEIRQKYNRSFLYEDVDFPTAYSSIGALSGDSANIANTGARPTYFWKRPHEIARGLGIEKPEFAVAQDSFGKSKCSEYDIEQGAKIGDCWYVAAVQALTKFPELLDWVIPADNFDAFDDDKYCGAFHFRFYVMSTSKWMDIVIDDRLPVDGQGELAFAKVKTRLDDRHAEFWVALIEKAYAKLYGSYAGIEGGWPCHALENFCGGFAEIVDLKERDRHNLSTTANQISYDQLIKQYLLNYLAAGQTFISVCSYHPQDPNFFKYTKEAYCQTDSLGYLVDRKLGLVGPHAYTVLDAQEVKFKPPYEGSRTLVKIRNPHATNEWLGAFSDDDDYNWSQMERDLRDRDSSGNARLDEGVFWMDLKDVMYYFRQLELCHFNLTDGTHLATVDSVWPATLQHKANPLIGIDLLCFPNFKFEVQKGPAGSKYTTGMGDKAIVAYSVIFHGYSSALKPNIIFCVNMFKMDSPDQPLRDVLGRDPISTRINVGREANTWLGVDPGWYTICAWPSTDLINDNGKMIKPFPQELRNQPIGYTIRVFTENETSLEPISDKPKYEDQRPMPPSRYEDLFGDLSIIGLDNLDDMTLGGLRRYKRKYLF